MRLRRSQVRQLVAHAREEAAGDPVRECCGLLVGRGERVLAVRRARNVAQEHPGHFALAVEDQHAIYEDASARGWEVLALYHSHPTGPPIPSPEDVRLAVAPHLLHVIVNLGSREPEVKAFQIQHGVVGLAPLRVGWL